MIDNKVITINYSDEKLRVLVEEYITQQRENFTLNGVCSYILYWAMEDSNGSGIYEGNQMTTEDSGRVSRILEQIVCEDRIAIVSEGEYKKINE